MIAAPAPDVLEAIIADLSELISSKKCGSILIRLSWHDAGVYSKKLGGGCPNACMQFTDAGEGTFGANAGLPTVAVGLLKDIAHKWCPAHLSAADLWALAANVAIKVMGGPHVPTRFGRVDAKSSAASVSSQVGRLPDGDKGVDHLREIFHAKGFTDRQIVALSGAHTVGGCKADRSGFEGHWTENPHVFDNGYFREMLAKKYEPMTVAATGNPQHKHWWSRTVMLVSDLALLEEPAFRIWVEKYAEDQALFFEDFAAAWHKMQELGYANLKDPFGGSLCNTLVKPDAVCAVM